MRIRYHPTATELSVIVLKSNKSPPVPPSITDKSLRKETQSDEEEMIDRGRGY